MESPQPTILGPHSNPGDSHDQRPHHKWEELFYDTESAPICDNLTQWLGSQDLLTRCCKATKEALAQRRHIKSIRCQFCNAEHLDEDEFATRLYHTHLCNICKMQWREVEYVQGTLLAMLKPVLHGERLYVVSLWDPDKARLTQIPCLQHGIK